MALAHVAVFVRVTFVLQQSGHAFKKANATLEPLTNLK
jgi:hypothetical protein